MAYPYKAILFDWAYTLVDLVEEDDRAAFFKMVEFLKSKNLNLPDFEILFAEYQDLFYGLIKESRHTHREACFETVLRHLFFINKVEIGDRTSWKEILTIYYDVIHNVRMVYPEVIETLECLNDNGVRMAIISNTTNPEFIKNQELCRTELDRYFEFAIFSSSTPYRKPHPSIFRAAISRLRVNAKEILFVGDNLHMDVRGPQSVGISAAWLNRNASPLVSEIVPEYQITSLSELINIAPL